MSQLPKDCQPLQNCNTALHAREKTITARSESYPDEMDRKISNAVLFHIPSESAQTGPLPHNVIAIKHTKQEDDLIRMKALTLLSSHGIEFSLIAEALNALQSEAIHTEVDLDTRISTLCLTLALPNITVKVQGRFQRNPESRVHSIPISNSFQLFVIDAAAAVVRHDNLENLPHSE